MNKALIISMQSHAIDCAICGEPDDFSWGVPVYNGDIVSNDFPDWMYERGGGSVAVCRKCYKAHAEGKIPTFDHVYLRHGDLIYGAGI